MSLTVISERLEAEMQRKSINKTDLAAVLGVSDVTVGYWCHGKRIPPLQQVISLAEFFGVSVDYLVGLSDVPNRAPTLADDLGLSDYATANLRSIAGEPERKEMLSRLLAFNGLSSVLADIVMAHKLRRETPGNIHTTNLTEDIRSEVDRAGYVLLDNVESADYREDKAISRLKWAFRLNDGRF